jgi:hypothetical protein
MDDTAFDKALIRSAFALAARDGWGAVSVGTAAREAALPLERARARFPGRDAILLTFGRLADQAALTGAATEGSPRERVFDVVMRRFDALQEHRAGVRALLRALPAQPARALLLAAATASSMAWMLDGAGITATGIAGMLRVKGLTAVWFYTLYAWERDDSVDLSSTMAALDRALVRAEQVGQWLDRSSTPPAPKPFPEAPVPPTPPMPAAS